MTSFDVVTKCFQTTLLNITWFD